MHESFRIAQKTGLMFRFDQPLPEDMQSWLIQQLHMPSPALGIANTLSAIEAWPAELQPTLAKRAALWRQFQTLKRQEREGKNAQDSEAAVQANRKANLLRDTDELKFVHRNVYGADQVKLRLTAFWANHFTIGNTFDTSNMIGHAIDEGIIAKLNGNFADMLYGITTHPGMLTYLDNVWSAGERSEKAKACRRQVDCHAGLNDNLGRELLELHTVSPAAGYSEDDIHSTAKVLAGWGSDFAEDTARMRKQTGGIDHWDAYKKRWAEPGDKKVLGQRIYGGKKGLRQLTDYLAMHEHTIDYIATKLCRHFISNQPAVEEINAVKQVWRDTHGDLLAIHSKVLNLAIASTETRFLWPMTWLFQVVRLSGATFFQGWEQRHQYSNDLMRTRKVFKELGQSFWSARQPNGYADDPAEWMSAEMFERRLRFAHAIFEKGLVRRSTDKIMHRIGASPATRQLVASVGMSPRDQFVALMCSPELMGLEYA